jgi:hypothetical protein
VQRHGITRTISRACGIAVVAFLKPVGRHRVEAEALLAPQHEAPEARAVELLQLHGDVLTTAVLRVDNSLDLDIQLMRRLWTIPMMLSPSREERADHLTERVASLENIIHSREGPSACFRRLASTGGWVGRTRKRRFRLMLGKRHLDIL